MSDTTYEEAKRCPKCTKPGEERLTTKGAVRGSVVKHIYCVTEICPWYNTPWLVQVNADGSVPPPTNHAKSKKVYVGFEDHDRLAQQLIQAVEKDNEASTVRNAEIRRSR
jgi:hypothetical protein